MAIISHVNGGARLVRGALVLAMLVGPGVVAPAALAGGPPTGVGPTVKHVRAAPQGQPGTTVRFPTFATTTSSLTLLPNRVRFTAPASSAVSQLATLEATGRVTPKVVITLGSASTLTLRRVIVTSVARSNGGATATFEIALGFVSILPS